MTKVMFKLSQPLSAKGIKGSWLRVVGLSLFMLPINSVLADSAKAKTEQNELSALSIEQVEQRLNIQGGGIDNHQGDFIQKKYFTVLKNPFLSTGSFEISAEQFIWQTLKPIDSAIIFKNDQLYFKDSSGIKKAPAQAASIAILLRDLIGGDFAGLTSKFTFYGDQTSAHCVTLKPIQASMRTFIEQIILCGESNVDSLVLYDTNMNRTEISMSYTQSYNDK